MGGEAVVNGHDCPQGAPTRHVRNDPPRGRVLAQPHQGRRHHAGPSAARCRGLTPPARPLSRADVPALLASRFGVDGVSVRDDGRLMLDDAR
jgi:hypothetical protein